MIQVNLFAICMSLQVPAALSQLVSRQQAGHFTASSDAFMPCFLSRDRQFNEVVLIHFQTGKNNTFGPRSVLRFMYSSDSHESTNFFLDGVPKAPYFKHKRSNPDSLTDFSVVVARGSGLTEELLTDWRLVCEVYDRNAFVCTNIHGCTNFENKLGGPLGQSSISELYMHNITGFEVLFPSDETGNLSRHGNSFIIREYTKLDYLLGMNETTPPIYYLASLGNFLITLEVDKFADKYGAIREDNAWPKVLNYTYPISPFFRVLFDPVRFYHAGTWTMKVSLWSHQYLVLHYTTQLFLNVIFQARSAAAVVHNLDRAFVITDEYQACKSKSHFTQAYSRTFGNSSGIKVSYDLIANPTNFTATLDHGHRLPRLRINRQKINVSTCHANVWRISFELEVINAQQVYLNNIEQLTTWDFVVSTVGSILPLRLQFTLMQPETYIFSIQAPNNSIVPHKSVNTSTPILETNEGEKFHVSIGCLSREALCSHIHEHSPHQITIESFHGVYGTANTPTQPVLYQINSRSRSKRWEICLDFGKVSFLHAGKYRLGVALNWGSGITWKYQMQFELIVKFKPRPIPKASETGTKSLSNYTDCSSSTYLNKIVEDSSKGSRIVMFNFDLLMPKHGVVQSLKLIKPYNQLAPLPIWNETIINSCRKLVTRVAIVFNVTSLTDAVLGAYYFNCSTNYGNVVLTAEIGIHRQSLTSPPPPTNATEIPTALPPEVGESTQANSESVSLVISLVIILVIVSVLILLIYKARKAKPSTKFPQDKKSADFEEITTIRKSKSRPLLSETGLGLGHRTSRHFLTPTDAPSEEPIVITSIKGV